MKPTNFFQCAFLLGSFWAFIIVINDVISRRGKEYKPPRK